MLAYCRSFSEGDAGSITITVDGLMQLLNFAIIFSDTLAQGNAGSVIIDADALLVDASYIESGATSSSSGHVGRVMLNASTIILQNDARISIEASQTLLDPDTDRPDSGITIYANRFDIDGSRVTTESTGNVPAADIDIGGGILYLTNGRIITSAETDALTGGNIYLNPKQLILDGGFIQANAAAEGARGGEIVIDTRALIVPATSRLEVGNPEREQFTPGSGRNIIQAAAPGGEQGTISLLAPELDFGAISTPLTVPMGNPEDMLGDVCDAFVTGRPSTLIDRGTGGIPPEPELTTGVDITPERLERILAE